jgi:hypothetical protein
MLVLILALPGLAIAAGGLALIVGAIEKMKSK